MEITIVSWLWFLLAWLFIIAIPPQHIPLDPTCSSYYQYYPLGPTQLLPLETAHLEVIVRNAGPLSRAAAPVTVGNCDGFISLKTRHIVMCVLALMSRYMVVLLAQTSPFSPGVLTSPLPLNRWSVFGNHCMWRGTLRIHGKRGPLRYEDLIDINPLQISLSCSYWWNCNVYQIFFEINFQCPVSYTYCGNSGSTRAVVSYLFLHDLKWASHVSALPQQMTCDVPELIRGSIFSLSLDFQPTWDCARTAEVWQMVQYLSGVFGRPTAWLSNFRCLISDLCIFHSMLSFTLATISWFDNPGHSYHRNDRWPGHGQQRRHG